MTTHSKKAQEIIEAFKKPISQRKNIENTVYTKFIEENAVRNALICIEILQQYSVAPRGTKKYGFNDWQEIKEEIHKNHKK